MKYLNLFSTTVALFLFLNPSPAQQPNAMNRILLQKNTPLSQWQQHKNMAAKSTAAGSRLIATVDLENDGNALAPTDSVVFSYSGTRGGDLDHTMKFDTGTAFNYVPPGNYINGSAAAQTFDAANNILTQHIWEWQMATNSWANSGLALFDYDVNNNQLKRTIKDWDIPTGSWINNYRDTAIYDANNNQLSDTWQNWDAATSTWVNSEEDMYTYMPNNKLATTFIKSWNAPLSKWDTIAYYLNIQDGNGNIMLTTVQSYDFTNNVWVNSSKDSFTYDAQHNMLTDMTFHWNTQSSVWFKTSLITYSNFTGNVPQTETNQHWDDLQQQFANSELTTNTYNSFEQLTSFTTAFWDSIAWAAPHIGGRDYYELYALKVSALNNTKGFANIYPVPAKNEVTINVNWDEPQASNITLCTAAGAVMGSWQVTTANDFKKTISVSSLPVGTYFIKIDGTKGHITQQLLIAH